MASWSWGKKTKEITRKSTGQKEPYTRPETEEDEKLKRLRNPAHKLESESYDDEDAKEDVEEANKANRFKKLRGFWRK